MAKTKVDNFEPTEVWSVLSKYFIQEQPAKGLLLIGDIGTGKTLGMQCYQEIMRELKGGRKFHIIGTRHVIREFQTDGVKCVDKYGRESYYAVKNSAYAGFDRDRPKTYCFDDLGLEDTNSQLYGNKANVIGEVFLDRYEEMKNNGMLTHATTNVSIGKIAAIYGDRLIDRIKEMMHIVTITGKSFRK